MLNSESVSRYCDKCKEIGNIDPYMIPPHMWKDITTLLGGDLPDLRHSDIYQYLINFKSTYNHKELRAYRSLEAYKYFVAGWVSDLHIADIKQGNASTAGVPNLLCVTAPLPNISDFLGTLNRKFNIRVICFKPPEGQNTNCIVNDCSTIILLNKGLFFSSSYMLSIDISI